jgi:hypothetical protein
LAVRTRRNAYGSQQASFDALLEIVGLTGGPLDASFIRAPQIEAILTPEVEVLAQIDGQPVVVRQGDILAMSFHPEVTGDLRLHAWFCERVRAESRSVASCPPGSAGVAMSRCDRWRSQMSGHSKWANIKHRKARQDKQRGRTFAKLIRAIESAARDANSSDPAASPSLALAVQKARDADVPKDNIERACERGAGEDDGATRYEAITYEGYAPGGVAVLVDVLTDNRNRAASDMRSLFTRAGGSLAEPGAVSFLFTRRGQVLLDARGVRRGCDPHCRVSRRAWRTSNSGGRGDRLVRGSSRSRTAQAPWSRPGWLSSARGRR